MAERIHFQSGERIIVKLRKHWLMLLRDTIGSIIAGLLPFVFFPSMLALGLIPPVAVYGGLYAFLTSLWLLIVWMALAVLWTNYYLDIWIVTDKRIISVDQISLFTRKVTSLSLDKIQEITVATDNALQAFFKFGTIQIETAGPTDLDSRMEGIPNPESVREIILEQLGKNVV